MSKNGTKYKDLPEDKKSKYREYHKKYAQNMSSDQKEKAKIRAKIWSQKNREKISENHKLYVRSLPKEKKDEIRVRQHQNSVERIKKWKNMIFEVYGDKCVCCGESNRAFLTVDHINGGGKKEKRDLGVYAYYKMIVESADKNKYQILCYNCNCARYLCGGICPHKLIGSSSLGSNSAELISE